MANEDAPEKKGPRQFANDVLYNSIVSITSKALLGAAFSLIIATVALTASGLRQLTPAALRQDQARNSPPASGSGCGVEAYAPIMQVIDVQTVVFHEGEHFVAQCLDVDVSSFGSSEDEALANLREALELYFEDAPDDVVAKVEGPAVRRLTLQRA
ncbi:MAG TPA: type II toxin-antitoxin system HicB family antitoxin [Solirubrobacterales bacterium]|nr:type II toxin-antitoxin system HicB family antitoxin [Solirubrobacterales bacterium]